VELFGRLTGVPWARQQHRHYESAQEERRDTMDHIPKSKRKHTSYRVWTLLVSTIVLCGNAYGGQDDFQRPAPADFSQLAWVDAFEATHVKFSAEYPFTEWKSIDWQAIHDEIKPLVVAAQAASEEDAFYMAMRRYAYAIPDGHITFSNELLGLKKAQIGGGYGLAVGELDNGWIIAYYVIPGGPAGLAGIQAGAEIIQWGGQAVAQAVETASTIWGPNAATSAHHRLQQMQFMMRAPVGTTTHIVYRNPDSVNAVGVSLTAVDDAYATLQDAGFARSADYLPVVQHAILDSGHGYVKVTAEAPISLLMSSTDYTMAEAIAAMDEEVAMPFRSAIEEFADSDVPGVILDIRGNHGGSEELLATLSGFFYEATVFQERPAYYNAASGQFDIFPEDEEGIHVEPQAATYTGPVIALVNPMTISCGEGIARNIQRLPQGIIVGFYGTNGSYGMTDGKITLPGGYRLEYPIGRSLDADGNILLDSRNGVGGIQPDVRVPRTRDRLVDFGKDDDVELEYAVSLFDDFPAPIGGAEERADSNCFITTVHRWD